MILPFLKFADECVWMVKSGDGGSVFGFAECGDEEHAAGRVLETLGDALTV